MGSSWELPEKHTALLAPQFQPNETHVELQSQKKCELFHTTKFVVICYYSDGKLAQYIWLELYDSFKFASFNNGLLQQDLRREEQSG